MLGADAFVAVDAAELVDALDAADQEPLEVELERDAHEEVDVERVVMGFEGPGCGAAGDRMERGAFDFDELAAMERFADRADDFGAVQEARHDAVAIHQIEVPHAMAELGIGEAVMLFGRRGEALGEDREVLGEDRELAGFGAAELAVDADDVAQVEALGEWPIVADLLLADEELDLARHVADVDEDELAGVALEDDAAGGADLGAVHLAGALFGEPGAEVDFRLRVIENGALRDWAAARRGRRRA